MSDIFGMQRANGDWFAFDHHGRLRVPLFHSIQAALIARSRNFELLVFKPVALDARFLKEIGDRPGEDEVDFSIVDDPLISLNRGSIMGRTQLASLIRPMENETIPPNGSKFHAPDPGLLLRENRQPTNLRTAPNLRSQKAVS